jgi:hypothetical protein
MPVSQSLYGEYPCSRNAPLACDLPQKTVEEMARARFCRECGFPVTLAEKAEVRGIRDTYRIVGLVGQRGLGRIYRCIQVSDNQPAVLKEYLLPNRCFNGEEIRQRKESFARVAAVAPADGKLQNFRLVTAWEAFADAQQPRCYFVSRGDTAALPTLRTHLRRVGSLDEWQVREVLEQMLQTLRYLHGQKFSFPDGQVQKGIAHGNLGLDSLLVRETDLQRFVVYPCDLYAIEQLFTSPLEKPLTPQTAEDLTALSRVALALLVGRSEQEGDELLDEGSWPFVTVEFRQWLRRLTGIEMPFADANAAADALARLPGERAAAPDPSSDPLPNPELPWRWPGVLLSLLALVLVVGGIVWYMTRPAATGGKLADAPPLRGTFAEVNGVPVGTFMYGAEKEGTWSFILRSRPASDLTVAEQLSEPKPKVRLRYLPLASTDVRKDSASVRAVADGKVAFAITSLLDNFEHSELGYEPVAYDGLFVFVASSKKDRNLPKMLEGKLTLAQLRALYTGKIVRWGQLGGPDLPVELWMPTEPEAIRLFEQRVLGDDPQLVADFHAHARRLQTGEMIQRIYNRFDNAQAGGIGFGLISRTFDQCLVFPLALPDREGQPVQGLSGPGNRPVDPSVNLCTKVYKPDVVAFASTRYPLSYPLAVVYPRDNSLPPAGAKFAEMLKTLEGQRLLRGTGLVPLQPLPGE